MACKTIESINNAATLNELAEIHAKAALTYTASPKFFVRLNNARDAREKVLNIQTAVYADAAKRTASAKKAAATRALNKARLMQQMTEGDEPVIAVSAE